MQSYAIALKWSHGWVKYDAGGEGAMPSVVAAAAAERRLVVVVVVLLLLPWLLQAVVRRPKEDRGNAAAGDLREGWQINLVASLQPLGGLL